MKSDINDGDRTQLVKKRVLSVGFVVGIVGFLIAVLSEQRSLGITVFMVGFIISCIAIITLIFSIQLDTNGRQIGPGIKIAALGFGVAATSQLLEVLFKLDSIFGNIFFSIGALAMITGILLVIAKVVSWGK